MTTSNPSYALQLNENLQLELLDMREELEELRKFKAEAEAKTKQECDNLSAQSACDCPNIACLKVQKVLAESWGYVKAEDQPKVLAEAEVLENYYVMFSNHTFRKLSSDPEEAYMEALQCFAQDAHCSLFSKREGAVDVHGMGSNSSIQFVTEVRKELFKWNTDKS